MRNKLTLSSTTVKIQSPIVKNTCRPIIHLPLQSVNVSVLQDKTPVVPGQFVNKSPHDTMTSQCPVKFRLFISQRPYGEFVNHSASPNGV